jgi:hypothetical protein
MNEQTHTLYHVISRYITLHHTSGFVRLKTHTWTCDGLNFLSIWRTETKQYLRVHWKTLGKEFLIYIHNCALWDIRTNYSSSS